MSKVLTDLEALEIIAKAVTGDAIDDYHQYEKFLEDLGNLMADHFGGALLSVDGPMDADSDNLSESRCLLSFSWDENVPDDGGVYKDYDTDVTVEEWKGGSIRG